MIAMSRSIPLRRSPTPGLDGQDLDRAAELVDDERRQRITIDVLGDDQHGLALLDGLLEGRQHVLNGRDLPVSDEDERFSRTATLSITSAICSRVFT